MKNNNIKVLEEGKTISLNKLPDCKHKESLIDLVMDKAAKIGVVAIANADGSWQAYAGYPDERELKPIFPPGQDLNILWLCCHVVHRDNIVYMGEKLAEDIAVKLFPSWKDKQYKGE